jgi:hypothetical protein
MDEDEHGVLDLEVVIDLDAFAVEIAGERMRHVGDRHRDAPPALDHRFDRVEYHPEAVVGGLHFLATACATRT